MHVRDHIETTHFFDEATGKLLDQPAETPDDPSPDEDDDDIPAGGAHAPTRMPL